MKAEELEDSKMPDGAQLKEKLFYPRHIAEVSAREQARRTS